jgi:hypothetical protein
MSLVVFPPKLTKGHLNTSFQSSDLETGMIYKSALIHLFHYAPQTNRKLVKDAAKEIEEERNEINWHIIEKDRKQVSLMIEGVKCVNTMGDVAMTCANIAAYSSQSLMSQQASPSSTSSRGRLSNSSRTRKPKTGCVIILIALRTCQWFLWQKSTSFFNFLHRFCKT